MKPLVSIVIPAYNEEKYIGQSIESIISQSYSNWELIVVDDASTDSTLAIAESFRNSRIRVISSETNNGPGAAQNIGFLNSRGNFIAILAGDDQALPNRINTQVEFMRNHPDVAVLGTGYNVVDQYGEKIKVVQHVITPIEIKWKLLFSNPVGGPTVMLRAKVLKECGMYDQSIKFGEDMELWGRIVSKWNIAIIPTPLIKYRTHMQSMTTTTGIKQKKFSASNVVRKNIKTLTGITVERDVSLMLATWLKVSNQEEKVNISKGIETIIACLDYYKHHYCNGKIEYKQINKHAHRNITRIIRLYGINAKAAIMIILANKRHVAFMFTITIRNIKAYMGYLRDKLGKSK